jgi:hypothetical protein
LTCAGLSSATFSSAFAGLFKMLLRLSVDFGRVFSLGIITMGFTTVGFSIASDFIEKGSAASALL